MVLKQLIQKTLNSFGYSIVKNDFLIKNNTSENKDPIINISTPMNSISVARLFYYQNLFEKTKSISGDIVECGVGSGRSLLSLSLLTKLSNDKRNIWGFDSFEGFPEPHAIDMESYRKPQKGEYAVNLKSIYKMLDEYINDAQFIRSRITLVQGYFEETIDKFPHSEISLINLDVDLYDSYKICLEKLYPKLSVGGIVTFDEYLRESFAFPGAVKAINDFFEDKNVTFEKDTYYGKYFVVKLDSN